MNDIVTRAQVVTRNDLSGSKPTLRAVVGTAAGRIRMVVFASVLAAGCGGKAPLAPGPPPSIELTVKVVAAPDINPDPSGRPSPVVVRLFVLADSLSFAAAGYPALARNAEAALGPSRLAEVRRIVHPGERVEIPLTIDPRARELGIVAEFADLLNAQWRTRLMRDADGALVAALAGRQLVLSVERHGVSLRAVAAGPSGEQ